MESHLRHATAADDPGQRDPLGPRLGCHRCDAFEPVHHAVVGGYRQNDRGKAGPAANDFPRRGADRTHTRANAAFLFQEGNLGLLAPGKYADLLVLDRDYLTVPADEILGIKPLLTMVGGKMVYNVMH